MNLPRPVVLAVALSLGAGCSAKHDTGDEASSSGPRLSLFPPTGGQGTSLTVAFDADRSAFSFDDATVDFGDGILVEGVQVLDGWNLEADIAIEPDADLSAR